MRVRKHTRTHTLCFCLLTTLNYFHSIYCHLTLSMDIKFVCYLPLHCKFHEGKDLILSYMEFPAPRTACGTHRHSLQICSKEVLSARYAPGRNCAKLSPTLFLIIRRPDIQGGLKEPDASYRRHVPCPGLPPFPLSHSCLRHSRTILHPSFTQHISAVRVQNSWATSLTFKKFKNLKINVEGL